MTTEAELIKAIKAGRKWKTDTTSPTKTWKTLATELKMKMADVKRKSIELKEKLPKEEPGSETGSYVAKERERRKPTVTKEEIIGALKANNKEPMTLAQLSKATGSTSQSINLLYAKMRKALPSLPAIKPAEKMDGAELASLWSD